MVEYAVKKASHLPDAVSEGKFPFKKTNWKLEQMSDAEKKS